mmetsp:Transcript_17335/g.43131  ORF Transcript_17335/g.43131 Transcript_17335/m.43131 type:complete len:355 (+) Transcript_17335:1040-2104(+)
MNLRKYDTDEIVEELTSLAQVYPPDRMPANATGNATLRKYHRIGEGVIPYSCGGGRQTQPRVKIQWTSSQSSYQTCTLQPCYFEFRIDNSAYACVEHLRLYDIAFCRANPFNFNNLPALEKADVPLEFDNQGTLICDGEGVYLDAHGVAHNGTVVDENNNAPFTDEDARGQNFDADIADPGYRPLWITTATGQRVHFCDCREGYAMYDCPSPGAEKKCATCHLRKWYELQTDLKCKYTNACPEWFMYKKTQRGLAIATIVILGVIFCGCAFQQLMLEDGNPEGHHADVFAFRDDEAAAIAASGGVASAVSYGAAAGDPYSGTAAQAQDYGWGVPGGVEESPYGYGAPAGGGGYY